MAADTHREFKDRLYGQFARIGKALSSPHRLELLELLAQGERTGESLAAEMGLSPANTSQHLQALRQAALVETRKDGLYVHYRLADPAVCDLCRAIRTVAERRAQEITDGHRLQISEYVAGHIAGALSVPVDELQHRLRELPKDHEYVAYCRGPYCVYADRAVEILRSKGRRARRLIEGFPEWRAAGFPVQTGIEHGVAR